MRTVPSWNRYFMDLAYTASSRSKDPSTNVGAVIVKDKTPISTGYNGMPPNVVDNDEHWTRPLKYDLVIHAEMNAVARAAMRGVSVDGATIYVTHFPCLQCAKIIVASGIKHLYYAKHVDGWADENLKAKNLLELAGVEILFMTHME